MNIKNNNRYKWNTTKSKQAANIAILGVVGPIDSYPYTHRLYPRMRNFMKPDNN